MREILGRRRMNWSSLRDAALHTATCWGWPVLPGATLLRPESSPSAQVSKPGPSPALSPVSPAPSAAPSKAPGTSGPYEPDEPAAACSCLDPGCVVPGAHPMDPELLAATTDARMVGWWWTCHPDASLVLATGARGGTVPAPSALSLPAAAGARALAEFDRRGVRIGPVVASRTRFTLLVAPYELAELGEQLYAQDWVPSSLRFHGTGGYVTLPPSETGAGVLRWERSPEPQGTPWLPQLVNVLEVLVEASSEAPENGSSLTY
jgi:Bifunctional DNA primase/polymerase, N-terminal